MNKQSNTQLGKIKHTLRQELQSGDMQASAKLPSERELSKLFSTTRITIKDALISLETEGLIYREERRGWYVSPPRIYYNPLYRSHFHQMVQAQQRIAKTQLVQIRTEQANAQYADYLQIDPQSDIYVIERLRFIDDRAVLFVENILKPTLFENILEQDLTQSLTAIYQAHYGYETQRSHFDVIPTSAPAHVGKALNISEGQSVLKICRVNYKQGGELMDCEMEYWRPDAMRICIDSSQ